MHDDLPLLFLSTEVLIADRVWLCDEATGGQLKARLGPCRTPYRPYFAVTADREQMAA